MAGQKPKSEFEAQMHLLEAEIRRLETEYNMFFSGRLRRPPFETQNRVAALVKKHDQSFIRNTGDRFRFESIQNRYQKFLELVERQMTNRELGRPVMGAKRPEPPPAPKQEEQVSKNEAHKPAPAAAAPRPSGVDDRVAQLYEQLSAAKKQAGEAPVAMERLAALVKAQVDKFKAQGQDVAFKVAVKDGKVQLTAVAKKDE